MRRREFIALLSGTAAWPIAAHAQPGERMRRIGVLLPADADDAIFQARMAAFLGGLQQLGWTDRRNVRIDTRWAVGDADLRKYAGELVALGPDVVVAFGSNAVPPLQQVTRTIPIVFALVADPVGAGYVESLAQPGGNVTGFSSWEYAIAGKWLELLKEIAPRTTRVAVLRDSTIAAGPAEFGAIQAVAPSHGTELRAVDMRNAGEIERGITVFAASSNVAMSAKCQKRWLESASRVERLNTLMQDRSPPTRQIFLQPEFCCAA